MATMRGSICGLVAAVVLGLPGAAAALCDVTYRAQPGDTAASIAEFHYGDAAQGDLILYANQGVMDGEDVIAGTDIYIPCAADAEPQEARDRGARDQEAREQEASDAAQPVQDSMDAVTIAGEPDSTEGAATVIDRAPVPTPEPAAAPEPETGVAQVTRGGADLLLLTGDNYAPFSDKTWPSDGMATELVMAALGAAPAPVEVALAWEDDWSRHLYPLLDERRFDMGFPWLKPDCSAAPETALCTGFHFSDPLMELPIMLFGKEGSGLRYDSDADIEGLRLCRPAGYFTHDLDRPDRQWLSREVITLVQLDSPEACFEALMDGIVDAVTLNIFLGASKVVSMGLRGQVEPIEKPLSRETLHVIISKKHWRGTTHLYRVNAGLKALRDSGRYTEVVERHLETFWDKLK